MQQRKEKGHDMDDDDIAAEKVPRIFDMMMLLLLVLVLLEISNNGKGR